MAARMDRRRARKILAELAAGTDPRTGRHLGSRNPVNQPEVIRAVNFAIDILDGSREVVVRSSEARTRRRPRSARQSYRPWTRAEDGAIMDWRAAGMRPSEIAKDVDRTAGAVRARLRLLDR